MSINDDSGLLYVFLMCRVKREGSKTGAYQHTDCKRRTFDTARQTYFKEAMFLDKILFAERFCEVISRFRASVVKRR